MARKLGKKVSGALTNRETELKEEETLPIHLVGYFVAFQDLDRQRSHGFAPTRIPFLDIVSYADRFGYSTSCGHLDDFIFFVTGLDDHFIELLNKEYNSKNKK
jgi:hypothetical protein